MCVGQEEESLVMESMSICLRTEESTGIVCVRAYVCVCVPACLCLCVCGYVRLCEKCGAVVYVCAYVCMHMCCVWVG